MRILMIDNYDSFTYNLYQYFGILGADVSVVRNDKITVNEVRKRNFDKIVISPGPGTPADSGVSKDIILGFKGSVPILGVCLGHQTIAEVFGGTVKRAEKVMHGKTSEISHYNDSIFSRVPSPFIATRYHSLIVDKDSLNDDIIVTAISDDNEVMGIKHKTYEIYGIQFHPESILTKHGMRILKNFIEM